MTTTVMTRSSSKRLSFELYAAAATSAILIVVLSWPILFTDRPLGGDWVKSLWQISHQAQTLRANGRPDLFLYAPGALFYPLFAFYGGTLYAFGGLLTLILGDSSHTAYVATCVLDFAAAYGGWYWIARIAGLNRWPAMLPACVFVTAPYYVTLIYERGDWAEFSAVSMIPLLLAAGYSVLRAERLRLLPGSLFALALVLFSGSHNLTLLWGSTLLSLAALAGLLLVPALRDSISLRGVMRLASLAIPALMLNAWFLLPDLAYQSHTNIAAKLPNWRLTLERAISYVTTGNLFSLGRGKVIVPNENLFVLTLPLLVIGWVCISIVFALRPRWGASWLRVLVILSAAALAVGVLMTHAALLLALPRTYEMLQFSYRLESYILLAIAGAVLAVLVLVKAGSSRLQRWTWVLAVIVAISLMQSIKQIDAAAPAHTSIGELRTFNPELGDYVNVNVPIYFITKYFASVSFPGPKAHDRTSVAVHVPPYRRIETNLMMYQNLVHVTGAQVVGIDGNNHTILETEPDPSSPHSSTTSHRISVSSASPPPVTIGRLLSLLGLALLLVRLGSAAIVNRRAKARSSSTA